MNGNPQPEPFSFQDNATGKVTPVRKMTDQQLARYEKEFGASAAQLSAQVSQAQAALLSTVQFLSVVQFEMARRAKSLLIVPPH